MTMAASALRLPPELRAYITSFCRRNDLAALAQVHTSYQQASEQAIYRRIAIFSDPKGTSCLQTLSACTSKASLVRSLAIGFPRIWDREGEASEFITMICDALPLTISLKDLRISTFPEAVAPEHKRQELSRVLRTKTPKLYTLFCPEFLDIEGIITDQPALKRLGLYGYGGHKLLERHTDGPGQPSHLPLVFYMERESFLPWMDSIVVYPAFYHSPATICHSLASLFDEDWTREVTLTRRKEVSGITAYFKDFSNIGLISATIGDMARSFPKIYALVLRVQNLEGHDQMNRPEFTKTLSSLSQLYTFECCSWDSENNIPPEVDEANKVKLMAKAQEWQAVCPHLWGIVLPEGHHLKRDYRSSSSPWEYVKRDIVIV